MKRILVVLVFAVGVVAGVCQAADRNAVPSLQRFVACDNKVGAGFFWLDTTCGQVWWTEFGRKGWVNYGKPQGAKPGPYGTYVPVENKAGGGIFVLNAITGEGWWTNGREWKRVGIPADSPSFVEYLEGHPEDGGKK